MGGDPLKRLVMAIVVTFHSDILDLNAVTIRKIESQTPTTNQQPEYRYTHVLLP